MNTPAEQTISFTMEPSYQSYQRSEKRWAALDKLAEASSIDKQLVKLERRALRLGHGFTRGTIISRVCCDIPLLVAKGIKVPKDLLKNEAITVWSLGLGGLNEPKVFFLGLTISDTIKKANEYLSAAQKLHLTKGDKNAKKLSFMVTAETKKQRKARSYR